MKIFILSAVMLCASLVGYAQTVTTDAASSILQTTATLNATLDPTGAPSSLLYNAKFEYATDSTGSLESIVSDPNAVTGGSGTVSADISSLTSGTTYYFRVCADYIGGTATGHFVSFTTSSATAPTVTTGTTVSVILTTSADLDGNVTADGGDSVTTRGICWNTSTNPTTANFFKANGSDVGSFTASMTGLTAGTQYYAKAYATNSVNTSYGAERDFKTKCNAPSSSAATNVAGVSFTANWSAPSGGSAIDNYELDVATDAGFTAFVSGYNALNVGTATTYNVTGLTANTQYFYRLRAANDGGTDGASTLSDASSSQSVTTISVEPSTQATIDSLVSNATGELTIYFSGGNGDGQIIYGRQGTQNVNNPTDGTSSYTADPAFGSGSDLGNGSYVVFFGSGAKGSVTVTGLNDANNYYFEANEYKGSGTNINYNEDGDQSNTDDDSNLPIELLSFSASNEGDNNYIKWSTASEINNDYFLLERSTNGIDFEIIEKIQGAGNSSQVKEYQTVDLNVKGQVVYYRLSQVDFDGTMTQFPVISVELNTNSLSISATTTNNQQINIVVNKDQIDATLELVHMNGTVVYQTTLSHEGSQLIQIPMANYSKGVYLIRIYNAQQNTVEKKIVF
jgi:hypothetical protein